MKRLTAFVTALALAASGCATAGAARPVTPEASSNPAAMADFAQHIPVGSRVRVETTGGKTHKGTLMRADATMVVISPASRIPEPPVELPVATVQRIELVRSSNIAKTVAIGAAAGVAATFGVLFLLFAMVDD